MIRKIFFRSAFLLLVVLLHSKSFSQDANSGDVVIVNSSISDGNLIYVFENKRPVTTIVKVNLFCERVENSYVDKIASVNFLRKTNEYQVSFIGEEVSETFLEELFVHFNLKDYEIR